MTSADDQPVYSVSEELANTLSHGLGAVLAVAGLVALCILASLRGDAWHVVACSIYGATLVILYTSSALYHAVRDAKAKRVLRVLDHSAIYLLIAGTSTPFTLVSLRGPWGWSLFGVIWGLALLGVACEASLLIHHPVAGVALYLVMGWVMVVATKPLLSKVAPGGLVLLLAGGLAYTGGVVFYSWRGLRFGHAIWHLFVLAGSALHYVAVLLYVIPHALAPAVAG